MHFDGLRKTVNKGLIVCVAALGTVAWDLPQRSSGADASAKVLYLTFDDGPSMRYTPQILDILKREHVQATFFVVGYRCNQLPHIIKRIHLEGHEIGNHGYSHVYWSEVAQESEKREHLIRDILETDRAIEHTAGIRVEYYRPPGGLVDKGETEIVHKLGHRLVLWSVDSLDWNATDAKSIIQNVEQRAGPGSIVLFHDGVSSSRYTVLALPELIKYYRHLGYRFEALPPHRGQ